AAGLDRDEFDDLCDHILIFDKTKKTVIGTYRLLLGRRLGAGGKFYAENEFDLSNLGGLKDGILEMGRSCVHKSYRRNAIVMLLWAGIIDYVQHHDVKYIIGCPSVYSTDPADISAITALLKHDYFAPPSLRVTPLPSKAYQSLDRHCRIDGREKEIMLKVPSLVRSYLKFGAFVCGDPVADEEFGTVDFFMLLDVGKISSAYLKRLRLGKDA
ncbi:MAG: GNAT family N-acetyltransferase, partial [Candidatus Omnitrophica bacterium]|nr:GNAT family N-acetyltransferase [Candidatus Omnitrophota bacterium]